MNVFQKMREKERITDFIEHKKRQHEPDWMIKEKEDYLLSDEYLADVTKLENGDYYFSIPVKKLLPKSHSTRKRTVYCFGGKEKLLLQMMSYVLHDYDCIFSDKLYSSRIGSNAKKHLEQLQHNQELTSMYAVKADIKSYGNSINSQLLVDTLSKYLQDEPELFAFLKWLLLRGEYQFEGKTLEGETAALPGIPIHPFFTNIFLIDIDRKLENDSLCYGRYTDDILFFTHTREEAASHLAYIKETIEARSLALNVEKTAIYEPSEGFEHLGMFFSAGDIDISDHALRKLKRKMRIRALRIRREVEDGKLPIIDAAKLIIMLNKQTFFGRPGSHQLSWNQWLFPIITKVDGLLELDHYNQRTIRYVMTGLWSDGAYRVRYEEIKKLGYVSLVRCYYDDSK